MIFFVSVVGNSVVDPKIYVTDFGNFKQGFLSMKLIQNSNFRIQGIFFNNCFEKNQNKTHYEEDSSSHNSLRDGSYYLAIIPPCNYTQG